MLTVVGFIASGAAEAIRYRAIAVFRWAAAAAAAGAAAAIGHNNSGRGGLAVGTADAAAVGGGGFQHSIMHSGRWELHPSGWVIPVPGVGGVGGVVVGQSTGAAAAVGISLGRRAMLLPEPKPIEGQQQ